VHDKIIYKPAAKYKCRYKKRNKISSFKATVYSRPAFKEFWLILYIINHIWASMSDNKSTQEGNNDDLDLIKLFEKVFSFCKKYGRLLVLFSFVGMITGFVLYKISPKKYASTLLLHSFTLTNTEQINIIENWDNLLKNKEYAVLASHFNCNSHMLEKVMKMKATELQKLYISNNPNGFMVEVLVKDNNILDSLGKAIVYGLENIDYIKEKLTSKRSTLTQLIEKVKAEIIKLDSTKKKIEYNINNNNPHSSSFLIDISAINSQAIGLNEKLLGYQDELKFTNAVQVLHKFDKFEKPVAPKLLKSLLLGFICGFAIGYTISIYRYFRNRMTAK
jgi:hypothetical protein